MTRLLRFAVFVGVLAATAACADAERTSVEAAAPEVEPDLEPPIESSFDGPPTVLVRFGGQSASLDPWTYCYDNGCADGMPPEDPLDVGAADEITVEFPLPDWTFSATFAPAGAPCPRRHTVPLEANDDGTFTLRPAGRAGTYDVTMFGQGDGDLFVSLRWTTPADGPFPEPEARLALLADHDGRVDSYGVELELANLAATPAEATATITVRSEDGDSLTFEATRAPDCIAEGTVSWDGPLEQGLAAAALGEGPFIYEVVVVLDGARHVATATWPDDTIVGNEPSVALVFDPALG